MERGIDPGARVCLGHRGPSRVRRKAILVAHPPNGGVWPLKDGRVGRILAQDVGRIGNTGAVKPHFHNLPVAREQFCQLRAIECVIGCLPTGILADAARPGSEIVISRRER